MNDLARPRWRQLFGSAGPSIVTALAGALLVAGCGADLGSTAGDAPAATGTGRDEGGGGNGGASTSDETGFDGAVEGQTRGESTEAEGLEDGQLTGAVRLDSVEIDVDRIVEAGSTRVDTAAEELRDRGRIGDDDALVPTGEGTLGERVFTRARQEHSGIPVYAAEVVVSSEGDRIVGIRGHPAPGIELRTTAPANDYPAAVALAEQRLAQGVAAYGDDEGALVIFPAGGSYRLAWLGMVVLDRGPERVVFDAETGEILHRVPAIHEARDRRIYDFSLACRSAGVRTLVNDAYSQILLMNAPPVRTETASMGDRAAERLFDVLGSFYSFLRLTLDMDSFDDAGAPLVAILGTRFHEASNSPQCIGNRFNARWLPHDIMLLPREGLSFPAVIAHEFTHGLINNGSRLEYRHQSGALNEAISDALGVTFAAWLDDGAVYDAGAALTMTSREWQLRDPGGVLRDMRDPKSARGRPYPSHYDEYDRAGGVHTNSSIINQAFYLLAEGGSHPRRRGPAVQGIGAMRAARIFGAAAAWVLVPNDDFRSARFAFAEVAEGLHGSGSPEWIATHTALDAVGIPGSWQAPQPPASPRPDPAPAPQPRPTPAPAPEPSPPAPAPQPAPPVRQPTPAPQPTAGPRPDPTPVPGPSPAPQPGPSPSPQPAPAPPVEPASPDGQERVGPGRNHVLVLALVLGLALLGAAGAFVRFGPRRTSSVRGYRYGDGHQNRAHNGRNADIAPPAPRIAPSPTPPAAPRSDVLMGTLQPADGFEPIPLPLTLLSSREGMVIGRDLELCHVAIRSTAVSRRHVRLRAAGATVVAEDLNSLQGTQADGVELKPFEPCAVASGQILRLADASYEVLP